MLWVDAYILCPAHLDNRDDGIDIVMLYVDPDDHSVLYGPISLLLQVVHLVFQVENYPPSIIIPRILIHFKYPVEHFLDSGIKKNQLFHFSHLYANS